MKLMSDKILQWQSILGNKKAWGTQCEMEELAAGRRRNNLSIETRGKVGSRGRLGYGNWKRLSS